MVYTPGAVAVNTPLLKKAVEAFELVTEYVTPVGVAAVPSLLANVNPVVPPTAIVLLIALKALGKGVKKAPRPA
jgi:hypothetical protein